MADKIQNADINLTEIKQMVEVLARIETPTDRLNTEMMAVRCGNIEFMFAIWQTFITKLLLTYVTKQTQLEPLKKLAMELFGPEQSLYTIHDLIRYIPQHLETFSFNSPNFKTVSSLLKCFDVEIAMDEDWKLIDQLTQMRGDLIHGNPETLSNDFQIHSYWLAIEKLMKKLTPMLVSTETLEIFIN